MSQHVVSPVLTTPLRPVSIVLAGCGGTGSQLLSGLARLNAALVALGHPGLEVTVYDPDTVTSANVGRQLYSPADVGHPKAVIAVTRINQFFGLSWRAEIEPFPPATLPPHWRPKLIVSAVDTARARLEIGKACRLLKVPYWLDTGNSHQTGQAILGTSTELPQPAGAYESRLPTVLDCYPDLPTRREEEHGPSCSLAAALEQQDLFINQEIATAALALLWQAFRSGTLSVHGAFIDSRQIIRRPLPVDRATWQRMDVKWAKNQPGHGKYKNAEELACRRQS